MTTGETVRVFDPTGRVRLTEATLASRPHALSGLRPGILENRKHNARLLMETMVEALRERVPLAPVTVQSKPVSGPPSQAAIDRLTSDCDFVVVGSSD